MKENGTINSTLDIAVFTLEIGNTTIACLAKEKNALDLKYIN
jgi:hypothetical protein